MPLNVTCPHCGALLDVTPQWLGQQLECGGCSSVFVCPEMAEEAPDEGPKVLKEKSRPKDRYRDIDRDDGRWDDYEAYSQDDDPDSYLSKKRGPGFATASLVIGIISITVVSFVTIFTCGFGGFIQIILSLVGLILGYLGMRSDAKTNAIAGMVLNFLGTLFPVLWMTMFAAIFSSAPFGKGPPPAPPATATTPTWKSNVNQPPQKAKW